MNEFDPGCHWCVRAAEVARANAVYPAFPEYVQRGIGDLEKYANGGDAS